MMSVTTRKLMLAVLIFSSLSPPVGGQSEEQGKLAAGQKGELATYDEHLARLRTLRFQRVEATPEVIDLDLEAVYSGIQQWRASISTIDIELTREDLRGGATLAEEAVAKYEIRYAQNGDMVYDAFHDMSAKGAWEIKGWDRREFRRLEPNTRLGAVYAEKQHPLANWVMPYLGAINYVPGQNPIDDYLRLPKLFRVKNNIETVDGARCCVVSSGDITFWFDIEHGFALRRWVDFIRSGPNDPGWLWKVVANADFEEVFDGIWWPRTVVWIQYYGRDSGPMKQGTEESVCVFRATKIKVNEVSDDLFTVHFPPGTLVADRKLDRAYYVPKGIEFLDEAIARGAKIADDGKVEGRPQRVEEFSESGRRWWLVLNLLVVVVIALMLFYKRWRDRNSPESLVSL
jgi:hypothetical protein